MKNVSFAMALFLISLSARAAPLEQTLEQGFLKCIGIQNIRIVSDLMKSISDARVRSSFPRNHASTIDSSSFDTFQLNDVQAAGVLFRRPVMIAGVPALGLSAMTTRFTRDSESFETWRLEFGQIRASDKAKLQAWSANAPVGMTQVQVINHSRNLTALSCSFEI